MATYTPDTSSNNGFVPPIHAPQDQDIPKNADTNKSEKVYRNIFFHFKTYQTLLSFIIIALLIFNIYKTYNIEESQKNIEASQRLILASINKNNEKTDKKHINPDKNQQKSQTTNNTDDMNPKNRLHELKLKKPIKIQEMIKGKFTLVLFSTKWCLNCKDLWEEMPALISQNPELHVLELDLTNFYNKDQKLKPEFKDFCTSLGIGQMYPYGIIIDSTGNTIFSGEGYDEIKEKIISFSSKMPESHGA